MKKDFYNRRYLLFFTMLIGITLTTFAQVPTITSFSPTSGRPGDVVTLTGTNFNTTPIDNFVFFGAITRATVTAATATSVHGDRPHERYLRSHHAYRQGNSFNSVQFTKFHPHLQPRKNGHHCHRFSDQARF